MKLKTLVKLSLLFLLFFPVFSFSQQDDNVVSFDLNGVFEGGGGKHYIRQLGNDILWYGEEDALAPSWSNVAHGLINGDIITVKWADVPKGSIMQNGNLVLKIISNNEIVLLEQTGDNFATDSWIRINQ